MGVTFITRTNLIQQTRQTNIFTLALQLQVAATCALLRAGGEEDLQWRIREHHGTHVATVSNQPRHFAELTLTHQQRITHCRQRGHHRCTSTDGFGTDDVADVLTLKDDLLQLTGLGSDELHIQMGGKLGQQLFVGQVDAVVAGIECQQAIQRAGVQQLPAQLAGNQPGDRALARAAWPVDGDNRCH
ncbi:hypothetical protein D3C76_783200 [compost metagenome]